jgi:hypothetical protein
MREIDDKILEVYRNTVLERKFELGSGHMGNGISVWNRAKEVHGDYEKIAHIDSNRKIKYYIKNPPKQVKDYVEKIAKGKNPNVSATQKQKVFNEASQMNYAELDEPRQKFVASLVGKGDVENQDYFDGIHGKIVSLLGKFGERGIRVKKKRPTKNHER